MRKCAQSGQALFESQSSGISEGGFIHVAANRDPVDDGQRGCGHCGSGSAAVHPPSGIHERSEAGPAIGRTHFRVVISVGAVGPASGLRLRRSRLAAPGLDFASPARVLGSARAGTGRHDTPAWQAGGPAGLAAWADKASNRSATRSRRPKGREDAHGDLVSSLC